MKWQPIETAPKDGGDILVVDANGNQYVAWWDEEFERVFDDSKEDGDGGWRGGWTDGSATGVGRLDAEYIEIIPTHWMPLPEPPSPPPSDRV